jgi:hypothetical protein
MKVKNLYRKLRKLSEVYGGVVVFFDEADVLGSRGRGGGDNTLRSEPRTEKLRAVMPSMGGDLGVLNAILASMQGIKTPRGLGNRVRRVLGLPVKAAQAQRILHIMATNMPNSLDPALLRPGRIDRIFRVGYPSRAGRLATFQGYLAKVPHELNETQINELATMTVNATGAVIKDMVNEALIAALREGRESISWVDILTAKRLKEFGPPEGVEYVPFERHAVAVHEACHALAAWRLRSHLTIDTVTIEKGQDYLGMVASRPTEDLFTRWASEYRVDIAVALSSLAGEKLFFGGDSTSGVAADLDQATRLAALMTGRWGMSEQIAAQVPLAEAGMEGPETARRQVEALLASVFSEVTEMLSRDRHLVLSLAHALEYERTLSGVDVVAVFEQRRGLLYDGSIYRGEHAENTLNAYHALLVRSRSTVEEVPSPLDIFAQLKETFESGVWPDREPSEGYRPDGDEDAVDIDSESPPSWPDWPAEPDSTL